MTDDLLYGVFFFPIDHVWGWPRIVRSMCRGLMIGHEEGRVEHIVNTPRRREFDLIGDRGDLLDDLEGSVPLWR